MDDINQTAAVRAMERALPFLTSACDGKCPIVSKAILFLVALIGAAPALTAQPAPPTPAAVSRSGEGRLFISPMGEPFRDAPDNAEAWFAQADADHDGKITLVEFRADAMRFFAKLDTDRDHEIGPEEIEHYEQVIAPETGITGGGPIDDNFGVAQPAGGPPPEGQSGAENPKAKFDPAGQGATAYSYLALPEPVIAADTDFNRGVSQREFLLAAARRFALLDTNHDGVITRDELPKLRGGEVRSERAPKHGPKPPRG